jgi:hypothetical protein
MGREDEGSGEGEGEGEGEKINKITYLPTSKELYTLE